MIGKRDGKWHFGLIQQGFSGGNATTPQIAVGFTWCRRII